MNRRQYLAGVGMASTSGFALLAGCSGNDGGNENGSGNGGNGDGGGSGTDGGSGATNVGDNPETTPTEATGDVIPTEGGEAIDTGQAPPDVTQTPFENTNTVPEQEGLETGQAPNRTTDEGA